MQLRAVITAGERAAVFAALTSALVFPSLALAETTQTASLDLTPSVTTTASQEPDGSAGGGLTDEESAAIIVSLGLITFSAGISAVRGLTS